MDSVLRYTIEIKWSDEDSRYVVLLPEWADRYAMPVADGSTYASALRS
jgi:predicted RNase H-like HicB family nuclease